MTLKGIVRGKRKPARMVVYGPPKIGKSTLGSEAPNPIFITTEDGVDCLPVDQYPKTNSWAELLGNVGAIAKEEHDYKTVVLDTLNGAADLCAQEVCSKMFNGHWEGKQGFASYGRGWGAVANEIKLLLPPLDKCRARGMTVILLAHTGLENVKNPIDGDYQRFIPALDKRVWAVFSAWVDIILRAEFEHSIIEQDGKSKAVSSNTRILHALGSISADAGCRVGYDLPDQLELSWHELAAHLGQRNGTVDEVRNLWSILSPEESQRGLRSLGIATLDDLEKCQSQKVKRILNHLKIKEQAQ